MTRSSDSLAIDIRYHPVGGSGEFAFWMRLTPVDRESQLKQARYLEKILRGQGGWEVVMVMDHARVK